MANRSLTMSSLTSVATNGADTNLLLESFRVHEDRFYESVGGLVAKVDFYCLKNTLWPYEKDY